MAGRGESWLEDLLRERLSGRAGAVALRGVQHLDARHGCQGEAPRFPIYSIAKVLIAALVIQLAEEDRFTLEAPLSRWHPEVPGADGCSLRQVLGHRAGLRDYGGLAAYHAALRETPGGAWSREQYARQTWDQGLLFPPGSGFAYSNPGYRLLVELLEAEAGASLAELVRIRIAEPLSLSQTSVLETAADLEDLEPGESTRLSADGSPRDVRAVMDPEWVFHRTLASTPDECAAVIHALAEERLVSAEGLREMTTLRSIGRPAPPSREPSYGLGLMGDPASDFGLLWGHNGGGPGYTASAFHAPDLHAGPLTVCALVASEEDGLAEGIVHTIFERASRA